ncbi:Shedu immune nuclease family protein [Arthrobacter sp. UYCu712]|uniref:Shedu immune nuclease family protein n=1 Tax=Arthrobacter sp. UYCu712 TaxID=3156340 RepID=UPI003395E12F
MKLIEVNPAEGNLTLYPTDTRPRSGSFLGPKYSKIRSLVIPADVASDAELADILDTLPPGFTTDYEYGLGLTRHCDVLVDLIEESTDCTVIEFVSSGDPRVIKHKFLISFTRFNALRTELNRIKNRGDRGIRRVKETHVHNDLAGALGLKPRRLSLGLLETSKWMTKVAAGEEPLNDEEQDALLRATAKNAAQIASRAPEKMARLQRNINLVNLEHLVATYEAALDAQHNENWWQQFFEENIFALQLLFGGPTVFVDAQVPIGEGSNAVKGKKIADYLLKNALTNNAALVEIKKPSTKLMRKKPYREGVYGVQSEIAEAVTQVLDQALQLTRHEMATKQRTGDTSWTSNVPRCFVVAGLATELDTDDKKKSFDLYREHLSNVRIVTYDEVLGQLGTLHDFLAAEKSIDGNIVGRDPAESGQTLGAS